MDTMRAARLVGPGEITCEQHPVRPPEEGEVLVRTHMASICGSDLHMIYQGVLLPPYPQQPGYPGHEGVGEVAESRSEHFRPGDRVLTAPSPFVSQGFADWQTLDARYAVPLPETSVPAEELLMAQQLGTVIWALRRFPQDVVGRTVMVMGQGSAGLFFSYLLKRAGAARVIVSDLNETRLALAPRFGADVAVQAGADNVTEAVRDHTGGEGADFVVEAVGTRQALLQSVDLARPGAGLLLFGLPDTAEPVPWNFHDFFRKKLVAWSAYGAQEEAGQHSFRLALELIASGAIDVKPLLSHTLPIERVDEAVGLAADRQRDAVKVSITF